MSLVAFDIEKIRARLRKLCTQDPPVNDNAPKSNNKANQTEPANLSNEVCSSNFVSKEDDFTVEERACILSVDLNINIKWARAISKIRNMQTPKLIPVREWELINKACDMLYKDDFKKLKLIIAKGWSVYDIFGCDKGAPLNCFDVKGLVFLVNENQEIGNISAECIEIKCKSGSVLNLRRTLGRVPKNLIYELEE